MGVEFDDQQLLGCEGLLVDDPATRQKMKLYRGMTSPEAVADGAEADEMAEALRRLKPRVAQCAAHGVCSCVRACVCACACVCVRALMRRGQRTHTQEETATATKAVCGADATTWRRRRHRSVHARTTGAVMPAP